MADGDGILLDASAASCATSLAAGFKHVRCRRTNQPFQAHVGHLCFLIYALIALLFCATESAAFYTARGRSISIR